MYQVGLLSRGWFNGGISVISRLVCFSLNIFWSMVGFILDPTDNKISTDTLHLQFGYGFETSGFNLCVVFIC